ncbi:MAG TPA: DUF3618 domain-containing protein [Desulfuromonadaceae bacterium]|jgi:type III secretion system FlhB-like substrate exporter
MGKNRTEIEPGHHKTEALQQEIRETEAQLSDTLHTIEERLSPATLKQQIKQNAIRITAQSAVRVGYALKNKKTPAFIGAGLVLLIARKMIKRRRDVKIDTERLREQITESLVEQSVKSAKFRIFIKGLAVALGTALGTALSRTIKKGEEVGQEPSLVSPAFRGRATNYVP